ncbi:MULTISPECIES: serine/threonine-protein kinase [Actinoalloteichus]|uniref:Protein kinase family protein n=1 Tax=Actinoalloteichus fjordicus TaxID=1612552 RepID=A0AAC9LIZ3_9PSEU|nr:MULTISPECIES: serine/threonine-protein kinase [Actinoalloteichus]APU17200.1 protein kinase family protein [Actinoalloteichus fjordicus]APU23283.1 protein kinase family protein [Actinoalloteichus sp. GBA129-24]
MESLAEDDPRTIERYRLFGRLGAGGMGRVYLALSSDGRTVAIKLIHQHLVVDPLFRGRFRQEVAAARLVNGAYTAPVMDADAEATVPWLATVYVPGPSLRGAVAETGPLPVSAVRTLAAGLAAALREVHRVNLIHRDLTPANVLLTEDGPRVIDFGITRAADSTGGLTATGMLVGSPGFLSPEQVEGDELTTASDVFALGATLCFAASGTGPFGTASSATLLYRVVHSEPELDSLPAEVRAIVEPCLAKNPADRPTPDDLLAQIGPVDSGDTWLPRSIVDLIAEQREQVRGLRADLSPATPGQGTPAPVALAAGDVVETQDEPDDLDAPTTRSKVSSSPANRVPHTLVSGVEPMVGRAVPEAAARQPGGRSPHHTRLQPHPADAMSQAGSPHSPSTQSGFHPVPRTMHPTAASASGPLPAPAPPRSSGRRRAAVLTAVAALLVVVAVAAVAFLLGQGQRGGLAVPGTGSAQDDRDSGGGTDPVDDAPVDDAAVGEVPGAFIGDWAGLVETVDGDSQSAFATISLTGGNVGGSVGTFTRPVSGCSAALILDAATATRLEFHERDLETEHDDEDCAEPETTTVDLLADGTIRYTSDDPQRSGTFATALDSLPAGFAGEWAGSVLPAGEDEDEDAEPVDVELTLTNGGAGEEIGEFLRPEGGCAATLTFEHAAEGQISLTEEDQGTANEGFECVEPRSTVLTLTSDGGLRYQSFDPERAGVLAPN